MQSVIVVGGGIGGLATASLLAKDGYKVTLLEKNKALGGRAHVWKKDGFTFDMGPSWYLMPDVFERFFAIFGKKPTDYMQLKRLDPAYKIFFSKSKTYSIKKDLKENIRIFDSLEKNGGKKFLNYLEASQYQYEVSMRRFIYQSYDSITSLRKFLNPKIVSDATSMRIYESIEKYGNRFFESDIAKKILQYNIVFLGGNPQNTPAMYSIMAHIDFNLGVWYPKGGMGKLVESLVALAKEQGVTIKIESEVTGFDFDINNIKSVKTNKDTIDADYVVMNGDYAYSEMNLLPSHLQTYKKSYWEKRTIAPSAYILYLGINKKIKKLVHHNLFLENDWMSHFDEIFKKPKWPNSPSYYVCASSKTDPTVSPKGMENIFFLVPVAPGLDDNDQVRSMYFDKILSHFEELVDENIRDHIVVKRVFSHRDFSSLYHAYKGSALGLTHTLLQTAFFRPRMKSKKVKNLYYVGGYTHPGIGVPMVIIASEILRDEFRKMKKK